MTKSKANTLANLPNLIGVANGIAPLDSTGKVSSTYLPSYVDDVVEYATLTALQAVTASTTPAAETGKIYVTLDTNKVYRWSGTAYIDLASMPAATNSTSGYLSSTDWTIFNNKQGTGYNSTVSDALQVPVTVGGITAGTTAATLKAQTIVELIDSLLFPTVPPTYTAPTLSFSGNKSGNQEIGSAISQLLTQTLNKNDAGAYSLLIFKRNGILINTVSSVTTTGITAIGTNNPNNPNYSYAGSYTDNFTVTSGTTSWTAEAAYTAGLPKYNNKGVVDTTSAATRLTTAPQASGTLTASSASASIIGIYPYFWGVSTTQPTAQDIASAIQTNTNFGTVTSAPNKVLADAASAITITFNANGQYLWFATAASYADKINYLGSNSPSNTASIGTGQFISKSTQSPQSITSPSGYWSAQSFNIYISKTATTTYTGIPPAGPFTYTFS